MRFNRFQGWGFWGSKTMETIEKLPEQGIPFQDLKQEEALIALKAVMDELSKQNDRLQQFAHIVSHNLRSHSGNLELMLKMFRETGDKAEKELYFGQIENISNSLSETIHNLSQVIAIHNQGTKGNAAIHIRKVIQKALNTLNGDLEIAGAKVIFGNLAWEELTCEAAYLDSIVLNLLSNAVKYRHPQRSPEIRVETKLLEDKKQLLISDNGLGIDLALYGDKLFGMYKTFHKNKDARGIGLFITKSQVEAMGGKIWAESIPGVGSQFTVEFGLAGV